MVAFNEPPVAPGLDKMPSFLKGYSDSISQPKSDDSGEYRGKATGMGLATAGKAIEGVANLADDVVKGIIKTDVDSRVDPLTDGYITALKNIRDNPTGLGPAAPAAEADTSRGGPVNIMSSAQDADMPPGLSAGLKNIERLGAAQASGKPSNTEIDMKLYAELKDLRNTYRGWRDTVDATMQKATGKNIANELENSLRTDIARQSANADKEKTYWEHQIVSNAGLGGPGMAQSVMQQYKKDGDSNKVMQWLSFNQGLVNNLAFKKAVAESKAADDADRVNSYTDLANSTASHYATVTFANRERFGGTSPADIADKMLWVTQHPEAANDPAFQNLGAQFEAQKAQTYTETYLHLNQRPKNADGTLGKSIVDVIGPKAASDIANSSVRALFEKTGEFINNKQFSPAYMMNQQAEATQSVAVMKVLSNNTIGDKVAVAGAVNKLAPQLAPMLMSQVSAGLSVDLGKLVTAQVGNALSNLGGTYIGSDGRQYSLKQSIDELKRTEDITGQPPPGIAFNKLLNVHKFITDPTVSVEGKKNAINFLYDPIANKDVMSDFMDDHWDPVERRMVKGRTSAFEVLTGEDVTKSIRSYAVANDPGAWKKYTTFAKAQAAELLRGNVSDLNDTLSQVGTDKHYNISWNTETKKIDITNKDGSKLSGLQASWLNTTYRAVENINTVTSSLANIGKAEGASDKSVDTFLFQTLRHNGLTEGAAGELIRSMVISNGHTPKTPAPTPSYNNFTEEEDRSIAAFLRSPAGNRTAPPPKEPLQSYQTRNVIQGNLSDRPIDAPIRTSR